MRIISIINQKGGVGKTTSTLNIGFGLYKLSKSVLMIDLDPQAHLTTSLLGKPADDTLSVYNLLVDEDVEIESFQAHLKSGLYLLPSSISLSGVDLQLASQPGAEYILKEKLESVVDKFDYVLIDCPPALNLLTVNALTVSTEAFIPITLEYLPLEGLRQLIDIVEMVKRRLNKKLKVTGVIGTRFNRRNLNKEVIESLKNVFGDVMFKTVIRENIALAEAPSHRKPIYDYAPESNGAIDYMNLCKEIVEQESWVD